MTKNEWIEIGALGLGALALFVIFARSSPAPGEGSNEQGGTQTPPYLTYNQGRDYTPATNNAAINLPGLGDYGSGACNCGGGNSLITFSDTGSFAQTLGQQLGVNLQTYENNVLGQFPDYVRQFFNTTTTEMNDTPLATQFASLSAG